MDVRNNLEKMILGKAMKDNAFRSEMIENPKQTIERELGVKLPESLIINVLEEKSDTFYLILPVTPANAANDELTEKELSTVAAGYAWEDFVSDTFCPV